jgi:hypothetical protein
MLGCNVRGIALRYGTMNAPQGMEISSVRPLAGRLVRGLAALDGSSKLAIVGVVFGWFFMNTFLVTLGSLEHGVRFFDMSAVIADPSRLFFGGDVPFHRAIFGMASLACLAAPIAPNLWKTRFAWLGYLAPLALILACGVLLYWRTSGDLLVLPGDPETLSGSLMHLANNLVHRGTDLVSRHVAIGAGSYLALIGSGVLAVQGIRRARRHV